jgi:hypothetical protein
MTRVYKLEVLVVDHDDLGPEEVALVLRQLPEPLHTARGDAGRGAAS